MPARTPEDVHKLFAQYFAAGDIESLASLYEPAAVLLPQPGQKASGMAAIKESLAGFLAMKGSFQMAPGKVIQAPDVPSYSLIGPSPPSHRTGARSGCRGKRPMLSAASPMVDGCSLSIARLGREGLTGRGNR